MAAQNRDCIVASANARRALDRLRHAHGEIILHVTGGFSKTPICLKAGDLRIGSRDILLGKVDGVPVYEMQITPEISDAREDYILDVIEGVPVGFSLDTGDGLRFTIERRPNPQHRT